VALPAEVDVSSAVQVREDLAGVVQDASLVIADMTATRFCDSAGVKALVHAMRTANALRTGLRVAASEPAVTRVLTITGVDRLIEVYPSVAAAMADFDTGTAGQDRAAHSGEAGPGEPAHQPD
jgi:anti-sigma B factor antagonist